MESKQMPQGRPVGKKTAALKGMGKKQTGIIAACTILFFFLLCLSSPSTIKTVGMILLLGGIGTILFRISVLRERITLPFLFLCLWVLMNGISTLYATSGKFALYEFLKVLAAFCCVLYVLGFSNESGRDLGRGAATVLEGVAALLSLISIDLLSTHLFSGLVLKILGLFTTDYEQLSMVEEGVRMTSVLQNPNVFAGCIGIAVFLSLGLALSSRTNRERRFHLVCLFVNALAFVLAFSMGGSAMIALGFLIYLLLERKENRGALLVLMAETLLLALLPAFLISATSFETWNGFQPIPLICAAAGSALLCAADHFLGRRLGNLLAKRTGLIPVILGAGVLLLAVFVAAAVQWTGPVELAPGETLRRSAYPAPGAYTLSVSANGQVNVKIESQNQQDTMMHTSTVLYEGPAERAAFSVPEDSIVIYAQFWSDAPVRMERAGYEGERGTGSFPLHYKLLPGFIANRIQGLRANQNAIQRLVFFEDGLKLFSLNPIAGRGMGAFENGVVSIQSFYYETKYAHNHYIQTMVETGVIGLVLFLGLLATSLLAVWKSRRRGGEEASPLTAALGGALLFMIGHAGVEVVFSTNSYLFFACGIFALISLCCGDTLSLTGIRQKVRMGILLAAAVLVGAYGVLLGCNIRAQGMIRGVVSFDTLETAVSLDRFEWADYALSYVYNSLFLEGEEPEIRAQAEKYAERLSKVDSNTIPKYLVEYYLANGKVQRAFEMADKYVRYMGADENAWQEIFDLMNRYWKEDSAYREGLKKLYEQFQAWNRKNMGQLTLAEHTMAWLTLIQIA